MIRPYYEDPARVQTADLQDLAEVTYHQARAAYRHGNLRGAVGHQLEAWINAVAARAAYQAWVNR